MPATDDLNEMQPQPRTLPEVLQLANFLFREFQNQCFWHSPRALVITEELIPFVVKGLRKYGGHRGFKFGSKLSMDAATLRAAGYFVEWKLRGEGMHQAEVTLGDDRVRLDWTTDSAFRFFPAVPDEEFGYCLHQADLATNKVLALAGRSEIRDFLDILLIDRTYLSLGASIWAACGKDPGFTPDLLLDQTNRHSRYQEVDLKGENLVRSVDLKQLKEQWLDARRRAERLFEQLPAEDLGCLYLDSDRKPVTPDPSGPDFAKLIRHFGSIRGAWPKFS